MSTTIEKLRSVIFGNSSSEMDLIYAIAKEPQNPFEILKAFKNSIRDRIKYVKTLGSKEAANFLSNHTPVNDEEKQEIEIIKYHQNLASGYDTKGVLKMSISIAKLGAKFANAHKFDEVEGAFSSLVKLCSKVAEKRKNFMGADDNYHAVSYQYAPSFSMQELATMDKEMHDISKHALKLTSREIFFSSLVEKQSHSMPVDDQEKIVKRLLEEFGLLNKVSLQKTSHSMCMGINGKILLGVKYQKDNFINTILDIVHEIGHAFYRANLPEQHKDMLIGQVPSQDIDETLALLFENHIARSKGFAVRLSKIINEVCPEFNIEASLLHEKLNTLDNSPVRADSPDLTYNIHISHRRHFEQALMNGDKSVAELKEQWHELLNPVLGINNSLDKTGILQDPQWYLGLFGNFNAYLVGSVAAPQIAEKLKADGFFSPNEFNAETMKRLAEQLVQNICSKGATMGSKEILEGFLGCQISAKKGFLPYLEGKYNLKNILLDHLCIKPASSALIQPALQA